jgi:hypothetical protein
MAVNTLEKTLSDISSLSFRFRNSIETRTEKVVYLLIYYVKRYRDSSCATGCGKCLVFQLYIIAKSKLASCQHEHGSNISYSCLVICPLESTCT